MKTDNGNEIVAQTIGSLSAGVWTHVVVTKSTGSSTAAWKIYFNSASQALTLSGVTLSGSLTYSENLLIAARGTGTGSQRFSDANFDEFSFWDIELSQSEVDEIYNSGSPADLSLHSAVADLDVWWRFGDGGDSLPIVLDQTSNNVDMTLINGPTFVPDVP